MEFKSEVAVGVKKSPGAALRAALAKLNEPIIPRRKISGVVIKPSIFDPDLPGNTDVELVKAVIQMFDSLGPIKIVESDNPFRTAEDAFSRCGYDELKNEHVELLNLSDTELVPVTFPGNYLEKRKMPKILHDAIFIINMATVKIESDVCSIGAGVKNLFGLLPERDKSDYHSIIDKVLIDLLVMYRPNLSVIDLTNVVLGKREERSTRHVSGVIVGIDPIAVDSFCSSLLGIDPMKVNHLRLAHRLGLGEALIDRINVRGTDHQIAEIMSCFEK